MTSQTMSKGGVLVNVLKAESDDVTRTILKVLGSSVNITN